jgi:hypothetical protein
VLGLLKQLAGKDPIAPIALKTSEPSILKPTYSHSTQPAAKPKKRR